MGAYSDPRWQKLRLEVMQRDGWKCVACGDDKSELHVHHMHYFGELWETPMDNLQTLCRCCHEALGPHPKGGVWWSPGGGFSWCHCPICGSRSFKDKGSYEKCMDCAHRVVPLAFRGGSERPDQTSLRQTDVEGQFYTPTPRLVIPGLRRKLFYHILANPNSKPTDVAVAIGVQSRAVYDEMCRMRKAGILKLRRNGLYLVADQFSGAVLPTVRIGLS